MQNLGFVHNNASMHMNSTFNPSTTKATLWVFSPKSYIDTCKRPYQYNFNNMFIDDLGSQIRDNLNKNSMQINMSSFMRGYQSANTAILPSANGIPLKTSIFSDNWTWVLIIDNEQLDSGGFYNGPRLNNRMFFSGFCIGEPVSSANGISVTINPSCILKITHHTGVNVEQIVAPYGTSIKGNLATDNDIIPPDIMYHLNDQNEFLLRPQDVRDSTTSYFDNTLVVSDYKRLNMHGSKSIPMQTFLNSPKHHLQSIVSSATQAFDSLTMNAVNGGALNIGSSLYPTSDIYNSLFDDNIRVQPADNYLSLDTTVAYSIQDLMIRYPNLEVRPCGAPKLSTNDLADQMINNRSSIGSAIASTTIPMLLANVSLLGISFFYSSFVMTGNNFKIEDFSTYIHESTEISKLRVKSFLKHFTDDLYPVLYGIGGDFDLSCSSNSAGECSIFLIYKDEVQNAVGIYETPLLLGGINNPLIGPKSTLEHNAASLNSMLNELSINNALGDHSLQPVVFEDENDFSTTKINLGFNLNTGF